jgi:hypothetical protein
MQKVPDTYGSVITGSSNFSEMLKMLRDEWETINIDPKLEQLKKEIKQNQFIKGAKVIIFTESKETAQYLGEKLVNIYDDRMIIFSGESSEHQKRDIEYSLLLAHASWVFTIPKRLRPYFMHNRKLLAKLSLCAWEVLSDYLILICFRKVRNNSYLAFPSLRSVRSFYTTYASCELLTFQLQISI